MNRLISAGLASLVFVTVGCEPASAAPNVLVPQKGAGQPYGSRDPYTCTSMTFPKVGAISADMARQYFICGWEKVDGNGNLNLLQNVKVEVGAGVVPRGIYAVPRSDQNPKAPVYALRGSYDWYMCGKEDKGHPGPTGIWASFADKGNVGKNCFVTHTTEGSGNCYRTTFGDWKCTMIPKESSQVGNQPPPK